MALHALQLGGQCRGERIHIGKAAEAGDTGELVGIAGQGLRLLIGDHLQAMLDRAQETIGGGQLAPHVAGDPAALLQPIQRHQRLAHAQLGLATAGDQLLGLHEELHLADAAAPDLDVVAGHADLAEAAEGVDLPLHGVNVGDGREVEVLAPDEGREVLQHGLPGRHITGHRARLDEGGALPVLPEAFVVVERRLRRERHRRGGRVGPQPQVGAEHVAVAGALVQQAHQLARQAHEEMLDLGAGAQANARQIIEDDQVDVGGIVELEGAVLAHAKHDVAVRRVGQPLAPRLRLPEEEAHRAADGRIRRLRQAPRHRHHRPDAGKVGQRRQQSHGRLELAQRPHGLGHRGRAGHPRLERSAQVLEVFLRRRVQHVHQVSRVALDQAGQVRRGAEDAGQQVSHRLAREQRMQRRQLAGLGAASLQLAHQARGIGAIMDHGRRNDAGVEGLAQLGPRRLD